MTKKLAPKKRTHRTTTVGKSRKRSTKPATPVLLHLLVTRTSGDTERYPLGTVATLTEAYKLRTKVKQAAKPRKRKAA